MKRTMRRPLLALGLILGWGCAGAPSSTVVSDDPLAGAPARSGPVQLVRVGIVVDRPRIEFAAGGAFDCHDATRGRVASATRGGSLVAQVTTGGVRLELDGTILVESPLPLRLRLTGSHDLWSAKRNEYAGDMILHRAGREALTLVNVVGVEEYLRGVVPWEIGRPDDAVLEAVKAQAIAARTYAYGHLGHWEELGFDLWDSVTDQVYRGRTGVHAVTDRAVRETKGEVAVYHGELIRAYYSSTCGGHTSTIDHVWSREFEAYLVGRRDADEDRRSWCRESPHFRWSEAWSARELGDVIREHLPAELDPTLTPAQIGVLEGVHVVSRDESGRVQRLQIRTDRGAFEVWGDRIRWVLRPVRGRFPILRSTMFEVQSVRRDGRLVGVLLRGGGNGHGVGMCQSGALGMAASGADAEEILRHYYDSVSVVDVGSVPPRSRDVAR